MDWKSSRKIEVSHFGSTNPLGRERQIAITNKIEKRDAEEGMTCKFWT